VETVEAGVSLRAIAETLTEDDIGAVVVLAPHAPAGVVSERDIVRFVAVGDDLDNSEAADAISSDLVYARPDDSVADVAAMMLDSQIRHVPILRDQTLVGLVSIRDVLQVCVANAERVATNTGCCPRAIRICPSGSLRRRQGNLEDILHTRVKG
jgi:signal-transduction protein with cAMP-binding, CBS, and nucleotidyltransferase domain